MSKTITAAIERWPVAGAFIISRGAKTHVDVVCVHVSDGEFVGRGEGTPIYYEGETAESCVSAIREFAAANPQFDKDRVNRMMQPGAARNALDCALWNLAAQRAGMPLWQLLGMTPPQPLTTAFTISLGEPTTMERDAASAAARGYVLLKLKLTGQDDRTRVAAVHRGAPAARLIVDANESWSGLDIVAEAAALAELGVEMIEQPLPHGDDARLAELRTVIPLVADESCHIAADVARCAALYDGINIKLDKAGGLTEAMKIADAARAAGLDMMVGCMLSTSLGIAPAFLPAQSARWVDLDGPALLARDRKDGFVFADGMIAPPTNQN
ncbi:MAG: N-acetyl-D-Glu racemase DgcA [Parasphingorhabdus sp.]|nr:N-acetyl-D-Glu racemase DgcA [Parasphingorhabdus sp.]